MIKSLMAKIYCLRVEKLFPFFMCKLKLYKVIFCQVFSFLLTGLLLFPLNILKSKMGLNHLLCFFQPRRGFG